MFRVSKNVFALRKDEIETEQTKHQGQAIGLQQGDARVKLMRSYMKRVYSRPELRCDVVERKTPTHSDRKTQLCWPRMMGIIQSVRASYILFV